MVKKHLFILLFCLPQLLCAELPDVDPHTDFDPIPLTHFNRLIESIAAKELFALTDVPDRPVVKGQRWKDWGANLITMTGDIHTVRFRFVDTRTVPKKADESRAPSFDLVLNFEDSRFIENRMALFAPGPLHKSPGSDSYRFVLKHSLAARPEEANGIRISVTDHKENRIFFNGLDETGIAVFTPRVPRTGFGGRALLLCPRNFDVWRAKRGLTKLEVNDYELNSVGFEVSGVAKGRVGSGMGPGYAQATIQTSKNITPSRYPVDVSVTNYPYASVLYRPGTPIDAVGLSGQELITAGLRLALTHHNSFSHKTESIANVVLGIRKMEVKAPLEIMYNSKPYVIERGECFAVLKEIQLVQTHTKAPLPSRSLEKQDVIEESSEKLPGDSLFDEHDGLDTRQEDAVSPLDLLLEE